MKQIKINPNNEKYYSSEFIKGFNCGAQRQFEADMADRKTEPTQNQHIQSVESVGEDRKTENSSEKPNNCGHITEDGVTCAKYPACDDCLDNPLNKLKGSERLVKGSEQTDCQTCKWWSSYGYCVHRECKGYEPKTERSE